MSIHPAAIVSARARIHETAEIGPFCVIGDDVEIGARSRLIAHIYCEGVTVIGEDNVFYPYSTVGVASQDKKYQGERAETHIGNRNTIREFVTIHRGTRGGGLLTRIGDGNLLMAYVHVAHDVRIGNHTTLANGVTFAGHVIIEDNANIGAHSGVHQFCRIGRYSIVGGYSVVVQDVLPFSNTVSDREIRVFGANRIGMERAGFPSETIEGLQTALRLLTRAGLNTTQALERIHEEVPGTPELRELIEFIRTSERGVIKG
jgi:UDP-N-acetylglucosamine acyltransferase